MIVVTCGGYTSNHWESILLPFHTTLHSPWTSTSTSPEASLLPLFWPNLCWGYQQRKYSTTLFVHFDCRYTVKCHTLTLTPPKQYHENILERLCAGLWFDGWWEVSCLFYAEKSYDTVTPVINQDCPCTIKYDPNHTSKVPCSPRIFERCERNRLRGPGKCDC